MASWNANILSLKQQMKATSLDDWRWAERGRGQRDGKLTPAPRAARSAVNFLLALSHSFTAQQNSGLYVPHL